ncbi:50S ribosomal protein L10 [bacterium]|nr:MAG: 50S ribosomal protein L10 [bacterium]
MEKVKKQEIAEEIRDMLNNSGAVYFTDFTGMSVAQVDELRNEFFKGNIKYRVVKNTLAKMAIKESNAYSSFSDQLNDFLKGPTAIVFSDKDIVVPAKILKKYFAKLEKPKFKMAVVDNQFYGSDKLNELASMLTKEEIISGILSSLDSPVSGIVGVLNAVIRDLASVIEESAKNKAA